MTLHTMRDLVELELQELYGAEHALIKALPKIARAAASEELRLDLEDNVEMNRDQLARLEQVFTSLGLKPDSRETRGLQGLIADCEEIASAAGDTAVRDAALIGAVQHLEHWQIAAYGTCCAHARRADMTEVASLLNEILGDEHEADQELTQVAETEVNVQAARQT